MENGMSFSFLSQQMIDEILENRKNSKFFFSEEEIQHILEPHSLLDYFIEIPPKEIEEQGTLNKVIDEIQDDSFTSKFKKVYLRTYQSGGACFFRSGSINRVEMMLLFGEVCEE